MLPSPAHEGFCTHCVLDSLQQVDGEQLLGIDPVPVKHLDTQCLCFGLLHHEPFALVPYRRQRILLVLLQIISLIVSMLVKKLQQMCCHSVAGDADLQHSRKINTYLQNKAFLLHKTACQRYNLLSLTLSRDGIMCLQHE